MIFSLDLCPNCNAPWYKEKYLYLAECSCGMRVGSTLLSVKMINSVRKTLGEYVIEWRYSDECVYFETSGILLPILGYLPWLPYDITLEQFKVYLTFQ